VAFEPGMTFERRLHDRNRRRALTLKDLIGKSAAQHVGGDIPGPGAWGEQDDERRKKSGIRSHTLICKRRSISPTVHET